jgi:hypothetical protein
MAERHVAEGEARGARQEAVVAKLSLQHHPNEAATARRLLMTFQTTLDLARDHLRIEREKVGPAQSQTETRPQLEVRLFAAL